jgi:hypothetical protein
MPVSGRRAPDERERIFAWAAADIHDVHHRPPLCLILASSQPDGFVVCAHARIEASHDSAQGAVAGETGRPSSARTLWFAGPTGDPAQRHEYQAVESPGTLRR